MNKLLAGTILSGGVLLFHGADAQVQFPNQQPGPPAQANVWVQGGVGSNVKTYKLASLSSTWTVAGDVIQIQGSATRTVKIPRIYVHGLSTAAVDSTVLLVRQSTANTAGTCVDQASAIAKVDTNNVAPTATIQLCSAAPTSGTTVANVGVCRFLTGNTTTGGGAACDIKFGMNNDQALVLRGTSDFLAVRTTAFGAGGVIDLDVTFQEEP